MYLIQVSCWPVLLLQMTQLAIAMSLHSLTGGMLVSRWQNTTLHHIRRTNHIRPYIQCAHWGRKEILYWWIQSGFGLCRLNPGCYW